MVTVCVIYRYGGVNLVTLHADLLKIDRRVLLKMTVMMVVMVDIVVHAVAEVEEQIGTPDVFIHVARYISTHSPL